MTALTNETILHRAPEMDLILESNGCIVAQIGQAQRRLGPHALALLDVFSHSKSIQSALAELSPRIRGDQALDEVLAGIIELVEIQALHAGERDARRSGKPFPMGMYDSPGVHIRILRDEARRSAYIAGVKKTVRPGDVVLDLGTGSGILAVAAVRAGAKHVYAVEPSGMVGAARRVFEVNGVVDKITMLDGWSESLELPEPANVLTCDLVGSEPLEMRILEIIADAKKRLLAPDARILPSGIRYGLYLADVPRKVIDDYVYSKEDIARWREVYETDFSPLYDLTASGLVPVYVLPNEANAFPRISSVAPIWNIDFANLSPEPFFPRAEATLLVEGVADRTGLIGTTEIDLAPGVTFSTDPAKAGAMPHYYIPMFVSANDARLERGQIVQVSVVHEGRGRTRVDARTG